MPRKPSPGDLTNAQWQLIAPLIPDARPGDRPRKSPMREVLNALLHLAHEGYSWRAIPQDFPHRKTCYNFFRRFEADGTWDVLVTMLRIVVPTKLGREPIPSGVCIDSQSVKTASGGAEVGTDGGKMVRELKRQDGHRHVGLAAGRRGDGGSLRRRDHRPAGVGTTANGDFPTLGGHLGR